MKRLLSWLVLCAAVLVINLWWSLMCVLVGYLFGLVNSLSAFLKFVCFIIGGTTILGLLLAPLMHGPLLAISASDSISASKKGTRYKVCGFWFIILGILNLFLLILSRDFNLSCVYQIGLGISFLISQNAFLEER